MITGLYSASRRLDPDPVHHRPGAGGQAAQGGLPGRRHRRRSPSRVTKMADDRAGAGAGARRVPAGLPPDALRPARPGAASTCRSTCRWPRSSSTSTPTSRCRSYKPAATRAQVEKALDMLAAAERPLIVAGGGIINADAADLLVEFAELTGVPGRPDPDGLGHHPRRPPADGRHGRACRPRTATATRPCWQSDFVLGIGNRWANRHTGGLDIYTRGPHVRARRHRADPDRPGVRARLRHRLRRQGGARAVRRGRPRARRPPGALPDRSGVGRGVPGAQGAPCSAGPTSTTSRSSRSGSTRR